MGNNIRDKSILGNVIGLKVADITQDDWDDRQPDGSVAVYLHFENGTTLKFFNDDRRGFEYDGADDGASAIGRDGQNWESETGEKVESPQPPPPPAESEIDVVGEVLPPKKPRKQIRKKKK